MYNHFPNINVFFTLDTDIINTFIYLFIQEGFLQSKLLVV